MTLSFMKREGLVWEVKRPPVNDSIVSPCFFMFNSRWYLRLFRKKNCSYPLKCQYECSLISRVHLDSFSNIKVITCLETSLPTQASRSSSFQLSETHYLLSSEDLIWTSSTDQISKYVIDFKKSGILKIVCSFDFGDNLSVKPKTEDKMVQTSSDDTSSLQWFCLEPDNLHFKSPITEILDSPLNLESLSKDLSQMLEQKVMPDVELQTGEFSISAHKNILTARSEVFAAMFKHDMDERCTGVIHIEDVEFPILKALVSFLYSGKIPDDVTEDIIPELYEASDKYAVRSLMKVCSNFLLANLDEENFTRIFALADAHSDEVLKNIVKSFIVEREYLLTSDSWIEFSNRYPTLANEIYQSVFKKREKGLKLSLNW